MNDYLIGKKQVAIICGLVLGVELFTILLTNLLGPGGDLIQQGIRLALTMVLCYFLYRGKKWAKVIVIILFGLATVLTGIAGISMILVNLLGGLFLLLYTAVYCYCIVMLLRSAKIAEYFRQEGL